MGAGCVGTKSRLPDFTIEQENAAFVSALERYDTDRDGVITCDDARLARINLFNQLDNDRNNKLNAGEYRLAKFQDQSFRYLEVSDIDRDLDLLISRSEFINVPDNSYLVLDGDGDCIATRAELIQAARVEADKASIRGSRFGSGADSAEKDPAQNRKKPTKIEEIETPLPLK